MIFGFFYIKFLIMWAILKLLNKYFLKSFVGIICLLGLSLFFGILYFIIGSQQFIASLPIIATIGIMSTTLMIIPNLIIELRKSLILKRIGVAKITSFGFLFSIFIYFFICSIICIIYSFLIFALFSLSIGIEEAWKNHQILNSIYACLILSLISIFISILIGVYFKTSMVASAVSFILIFISLFTSGLISPFSTIRQVFGLVFIGYIVPFDWPILMLEQSWGIGSYLSQNIDGLEVPIYYFVSDNIWEILKPFKLYALPYYGGLKIIEVEAVSSFNKIWNIFAPYFTMGISIGLSFYKFSWVER